jgi:propionate CoA-transferase
MNPKIIQAHHAAELIKDGQTLCIGGGGAGHNVPDRLLEAIGKRFAETKTPKKLKVLHPCGIGDNNDRGLNHLAHEGLIDTVIGGFWGNAPKMGQLALDNKIKGYNLPQGVLGHLVRTTAGGEKGLLKKTGLHTFVDPRVQGGKVNEVTKDPLLEVIEIGGEEFLFYHAIPIDVAFIRGTSIDPEGNLTMEDEVASFAMLSIAQAAKVNGGIVIAQVKKQTANRAKPIHVKVAGVFIDYIVIDPEQTMTFISDHEKAFISRTAKYASETLVLEGTKRIIARRAAMELPRKGFVNLGYGIPDGVPIVVNEEGILGHIIFMIEQGQTDGIIATGLNFGAMYNPAMIADDPYQFDFFHGGGLDICYLGFAQIDQYGNVNSSRFGKNFTGCGGFIDISQNTRKVVLAGAFAAKADIAISQTGISVNHPGKFKKFINKVEQITFNGQYAFSQGQEVLYCTERAIFRLIKNGIELIEIAPGIDLDRDVLSMMEFRPKINKDLKTMDAAIFSDSLLNLKNKK